MYLSIFASETNPFFASNTKLSHYRAIVGEVPDTEATVKGLVEGKPYEFRVAAVNDAGPGEFAETSKPIKPAPPPSMYLLIDMISGGQMKLPL